jgi:hypothetical protein
VLGLSTVYPAATQAWVPPSTLKSWWKPRRLRMLVAALER